MDRTKIVSFDMDGTITDLSFVDCVWLEGIPRLLAGKRGISFEDARIYAKKEYDKIGRDRLEWYDLSHWTNKFGLVVSPAEIIGSFQHKIRAFPEVPYVLEGLRRRGLRLIIISNARREFLNLEIEKTGIESCFERVFSSTSDFGLTKKTVDLYQKVCSICAVSPEEMVHVGDDLSFDFEVPKKFGIQAFYLDRTGAVSGEFVVRNLRELEKSCQTNR
jgi:putative hydrolase of the HAD superfamily